MRRLSSTDLLSKVEVSGLRDVKTFFKRFSFRHLTESVKIEREVYLLMVKLFPFRFYETGEN